jgi:hypothetical protein
MGGLWVEERGNPEAGKGGNRGQKRDSCNFQARGGGNFDLCIALEMGEKVLRFSFQR